MSPTGTDFAVYQTEYSDDRSILTKTEDTLRVSEHRRSTYVQGMSYTVVAGVLHETVRIGKGPAFTALLTTDVSSAAPRVLGPAGGRHRYEYERRNVEETMVDSLLAQD